MGFCYEYSLSIHASPTTVSHLPFSLPNIPPFKPYPFRIYISSLSPSQFFLKKYFPKNFHRFNRSILIRLTIQRAFTHHKIYEAEDENETIA